MTDHDKTDVPANRVYAGVRGLAELPYFEMTDKGLLRLTLDELGPGIDGHVHFALNSLSAPKPDLLAACPETRYYLDVNTPLSMNNYMGQNQTEADVNNTVTSLLNSITPAGSAWTVTHTIPNLIAEMDLLNINKAVVFPIAYGFPFGDDMTEWYMDAIEKSGNKDRFILCGSVKPTLPDTIEKVRRYKLKGLHGIKAHPNMGLFTPDDKFAWAFYEECSSLDLPVLMHCGLVGKESADAEKLYGYTGRHADVRYFAEPVQAFPKLRFVFCHSGALQNGLAIDIAKRNKNVWMDIQGQSVDNIRTMIKELGPERLMFGSDWPWYPEASLLVRMLLATEGDRSARKMIFRENAERFWGLSKD